MAPIPSGRILRAFTLVFGAVLLPGSASGQPSKGAHTFEFVVLREGWSELGWRYEAPAAPGSQAPRLFTATEADIESYDWARQGITLTGEATRRLGQALEPDSPQEDGRGRLEALKEAVGESHRLEGALYLRGFFVALDRQPLYWGVFLDSSSQMRIRYPVVRSCLHRGRAVFHVLPTHFPFFDRDPGLDPSADVTRRYPDVPLELARTIRSEAWDPVSQAHRERIQDERVRGLMEAFGKLRVGTTAAEDTP